MSRSVRRSTPPSHRRLSREPTPSVPEFIKAALAMIGRSFRTRNCCVPGWQRKSAPMKNSKRPSDHAQASSTLPAGTRCWTWSTWPRTASTPRRQEKYRWASELSNIIFLGLGSGTFRAISRPEAPNVGTIWRLGRVPLRPAPNAYQPHSRTARIGLRGHGRAGGDHPARGRGEPMSTEFVLESACAAAEETLLDQRLPGG
jgi:hypothetical protein